MKKIILYSSIVLCVQSAYCAGIPLKDLLQIKLGTSSKGLVLSGETKESAYEIETVDNKITSVLINFFIPISSDQYLKKHSKGYCLVQDVGGDLHQNRFFFFNQEVNHRYEVNEALKIKSMLVKEIPGARTNKVCKFSELLKLGTEGKQVKRVK